MYVMVDALSKMFHDPRMSEPDRDSQKEENAFLTPFLKYFESNCVAVVRDLEGAPSEVRNLLRVHHLRPMMMKHIFSYNGP